MCGAVWLTGTPSELQAAAAAARKAYSKTAVYMDQCTSWEDAKQLHQTAVKSSKDAFASDLHITSKEDSQAAWQAVLAQLEQGFALVCERIKRMEAEAELQHAQGPQAAKTYAVKRFREQELMTECTKAGVQTAADVTRLYRIHYAKATDAFNFAVLKLGGPSKRTHAVSTVQSDLYTFMQHVRDRLQQQLKARLAGEQACKAAAEIRALEEDRRQERLVLQARDQAVARYKQQMASYVSADGGTCTSLQSAHENILQDVLRNYIPSNLPEKHSMAFKAYVRKDCKDLCALTETVQQRMKQAATDVLARAVQEGLKEFDAHMTWERHRAVACTSLS